MNASFEGILLSLKEKKVAQHLFTYLYINRTHYNCFTTNSVNVVFDEFSCLYIPQGHTFISASWL